MTPENRAVFLDRDGVLIHDVHYLSDLKQVKIYPDVPEGLMKLKAAGYKLIVVTNQSGVARGYFDEEFVAATHHYLNLELSKFGVTLDAEYHCPHHVDGIAPLNINCNCRKPLPGMIKKASFDFKIDIPSSFVIGDKISDIELALNSKCKGILLTTGHGSEHATRVLARYPQTPVFNSFSEAVIYICNHS